MTLPTLLTILSTAIFLVWERVAPGRPLPQVSGWYLRALLINFAQLSITLATGQVWIHLFGDFSILQISHWDLPVAEGLLAWFVGTFVFYWWHRLRHRDGFWQVFHQIHHSPARIEILTSFYKHPLEILVNSVLAGLILYPLLGASMLGAFWYNFFAATGEYFYHANVRTPRWLRFFIQTPELHSIHHQYDVHRFNFSDIPLWDRLFGTYRDAVEFTPRCGFPDGAEQRLPEMLRFRDVYESTDARAG
jgi:sterol desaturase/sphingolipid hydroxylase (fatty acid hydroxylase superfamily)